MVYLREKQNFNKDFLKILNLENKKYYITAIKNYILINLQGHYNLYIYDINPLFNYINTTDIRVYNNKRYKVLSERQLVSVIKSQIIKNNFNIYDKGICITNLII